MMKLLICSYITSFSVQVFMQYWYLHVNLLSRNSTNYESLILDVLLAAITSLVVVVIYAIYKESKYKATHDE